MSDLSAKKLKQTQALVNNSPEFRSLGNVDVNMGIKVGKSLYLISFHGFSCQNVRRINSRETRDADFVIDMSADIWDRFIGGCQSGQGPDLAQLDITDAIVNAADPRKKLEFLRYHLSLQAFFEAYASLEVSPA